MSDRESDKDPAEIRESLDDLVQKLEQGAGSSASWNESISENIEKWEQTKQQIQERQKALKQLVTDKKAGLIGFDEFNEKYRQLQDELVELEKIVYNMKLGTDVQ
ncbi:hypothetical protein EU527_07160 [Candidatus Thorarchaeota archaeon]|nr:MAG: hypothetical protein EU527_07160 [Candidatus Thorarchaeota archaeon]